MLNDKQAIVLFHLLPGHKEWSGEERARDGKRERESRGVGERVDAKWRERSSESAVSVHLLCAGALGIGCANLIPYAPSQFAKN